jgi:hypothetical protein
MAPIRDERELYFSHTLDVAWIIALWHFIHGGDPMQDSEAAQTTELLARGLVGHLGRGRKESGDVVEKLNRLGIKLVIKSSAGANDVKTTKVLHELYAEGQQPITWCPQFLDFSKCWTPIFPLPTHPLKRPGQQ